MSDHDEAALDRFLAGEIFNSSELWENLLILCDDLGSCFAGTPEEAEAARFLESKLRDYGLDNVHAEPFEYHGWKRGSARLMMTAPRRRELECLSMPMAAGGHVSGRIIDLGYGAPEDFEAHAAELKGNIALVAGTNPPDADRWIHRTEKYNRSVLAEAAAFIWTGHTDGVGPFTGAVGFNRWGRIPAVMVSKETGLLLQRMIQRHGSVEAEIESADTQELKTSWNIIGDIGGESSGSDEMVVIGNHYDGHDIAQGAHDPKSGLVATLEMARVLAQRANQIKHKLRFICLGVEELGLIGAHAYVDTHADDIARTRFMFNLDAAGGPGAKGVTLFGQDVSDHLISLTASMTEEVYIDVSVPDQEEPGHLFADHFPFMAQGIPCGFIREPEAGVIITAYYHTKADTVDKLRAHDMQEAAFLGARLAWRIANDESWPDVRPSAEEVAKAQAEYDRNQISRQIETAVDAKSG